MMEHPIIFSTPMVRAILAGRKTQTRRLVKLANGRAVDTASEDVGDWDWPQNSDVWCKCPYGERGDRLWVRETWAEVDGDYVYRADIGLNDARIERAVRRLFATWRKAAWRPSIYMPRVASRILLNVVDVRVERLQDITDDDAIAEGCGRVYGFDVPAAMGGVPEGTYSYPGSGGNWWTSPTAAFRHLWSSINGPKSWATNPWVWVVEFAKGSP